MRYKIHKMNLNKQAIVAIFLLSFFSTRELFAAVSESLAVKAIMGEARGEAYIGKVAIGESIRNRGHLKGVYGLNAKFSEPKWVWDSATRAWHESAHTNLTKNADHWFSEEDMKKLSKNPPRWFKRLEPTVKIGRHSFYRRKK